MKIFISWSGERSHKLALLLHDWLPRVLPSSECFVSSEDIRKGARWSVDMARELEESAFGILCIVSGNENAPWLNFEAGALSKVVDHARVVPLIFDTDRSALSNH